MISLVLVSLQANQRILIFRVALSSYVQNKQDASTIVEQTRTSMPKGVIRAHLHILLDRFFLSRMCIGWLWDRERGGNNAVNDVRKNCKSFLA